jgi:hypothetical protein
MRPVAGFTTNISLGAVILLVGLGSDASPVAVRPSEALFEDVVRERVPT